MFFRLNFTARGHLILVVKLSENKAANNNNTRGDQNGFEFFHTNCKLKPFVDFVDHLTTDKLQPRNMTITSMMMV